MPLKSVLLFCFGLLTQQMGFCQESYWQQQANYTIDVTLDDTGHSLNGFLKLEYINNSPDTISFIWFHLWPNAFKNDRTAFSEQMLQNGRTDFYFSDKADRGYINRLDFRTNNTSLDTEDHPLYIDVIKVYLANPLTPGAGTVITTPFHVKIPKNFSRGGRSGRSYQITQWYPKPAVYDRNGWHPMPYLDQGEFYSEFGNFDVRITLPKDYTVASTGEAVSGEPHSVPLEKAKNENKEVRQVKSGNKKVGKKSGAKSSFKKSTSIAGNKPQSKTATHVLSRQQVEYKTLRYLQNNVHDFAWFADKEFVVKSDTVRLASGKVVTAYSYYTSRDNSAWQKSVEYIKDAIRFRSTVMGEYPYNTVSVVEAKMGFVGGMEYPTITSISGIKDESTLEETIEHEAGHNWLSGSLASNERDHPWMDEGMNSYYDERYDEWKYGKKKQSMVRKIPANVEEILVDAYAKHKLDQPISTPAEKFTQVNYFLTSYTKAANWMKRLEEAIGREVFDSSMREYNRQWQFKHPRPKDFQTIVQQNTGKDLNAHFRRLDQTGPIHNTGRKLKPAFLFSLKDTDKYTYINILPGAGYNKYDGFMFGTVVHNYNLPSSRFQFVAAPLFATGSKQFNGIGSAGYSWHPAEDFQRVQLGVTAARFSTLKGLDSNSNEVFGNFYKIVPSLRFTFKNHSPRSTVEKWIEWKTFLIGERGFDYIKKSADSLFYPAKGGVQNRYVNQLVFNITDYRALYPYDVQLQLQQGAGFYRANLTSHYFYNYGSGGGMQLRFFAAKFGYIGSRTSSKEFETSVYQPKLTAVRGNEDYTYSNYFIGRNESEYFLGQQVMMRDGGLKLRTDLFQDLQGRSDNWVSSINLSSTLPEKLFPKKFLRVFLDIGTYAEAWKKDAVTSRFLYVGGLQLSLFKNIVNVYAPLIYSGEFRDNLKTVPGQNKFFQRLSFSIDLHRVDFRRIVGYKVPI